MSADAVESFATIRFALNTMQPRSARRLPSGHTQHVDIVQRFETMP